MDKISSEKTVKRLTMLLMYLIRFNEWDHFGSDFDIINELD